jgi:hypothetical protein
VVPRRYRVVLWVGPLVVLHWLCVVFVDDDPTSPFIQALFVALFWGMLFGHTAVAAAWTAFGPESLAFRLPLALVWVTGVVVVTAVNLSLHGGPSEMAIYIGVGVFGQWLILQFPLWGLVIGFSLRLQHIDDVGPESGQPQQFTIRQVIGLTALVGVIFGIGRIVAPSALQSLDTHTSFAKIIAFLGVAQVVLTLPLLLASLLHRFAIPGVLLALTLILVSVIWEVPLLNAMVSGSAAPMRVLIAMNAGTALTMLVLLMAVRLNGYSLARIQQASAQ